MGGGSVVVLDPPVPNSTRPPEFEEEGPLSSSSRHPSDPHALLTLLLCGETNRGARMFVMTQSILRPGEPERQASRGWRGRRAGGHPGCSAVEVGKKQREREERGRTVEEKERERGKMTRGVHHE
jgi:hypothetical protein